MIEKSFPAVSTLFARAGRRHRSLLAVVGASLLVAVGLAALRGTKYTSTFSFVPVGIDAASGGLAALAGQFGVRVPPNSDAMSPLLYAEVLRTRAFLDTIADSKVSVTGAISDSVTVSELFGLDDVDSLKRRSQTAAYLRNKAIQSFVATRTSGSVTVAVSAPTANAAWELATIALKRLEEFNRRVATYRASEERRFLEDRVAATSEELEGAEQRLASFLRSNRQFQDSPELTFERERLQREVQRHADVFSRLVMELEESRIREARDTPMLTVIESPTMPVKPHRRQQIATALLAFLLLATAGSFRVLYSEGGADSTLARRGS